MTLPTPNFEYPASSDRISEILRSFHDVIQTFFKRDDKLRIFRRDVVRLSRIVREIEKFRRTLFRTYKLSVAGPEAYRPPSRLFDELLTAYGRSAYHDILEIYGIEHGSVRDIDAENRREGARNVRLR